MGFLIMRLIFVIVVSVADQTGLSLNAKKTTTLKTGFS